MRILVVEDDPDGGRVLCKGLREQAFAVDLAIDGSSALHKIFVNSYDLIVLDFMLPGKDGREVCRELRASGNDIPILMLTARDQVPDRIAGLNAGADDYVVKPFDLGELLARVHALLRRRPRVNSSILEVADLRIDTHQRKVFRANRPIVLTAKEYALLEYLAWREGAVVGRAEISEHVWDETYDPTSNLIEVYVQRLRRKVDGGKGVRLIHTRRGEGYQLNPGAPDAD
ncbi:MAG TPA: response regulator transcription factor [Bryobacteraceae bacterium]|nr:response regulator transcription factor [Bryobacteraceae bacterium]